MTPDLDRIYTGDCLAVMRSWPDDFVQTCITSPPYWGLRDYGVDGQLGLEKTPEAYVTKMTEVFREVKRVLKDDGTLWLNLGDSYNGYPGNVTRGGKLSGSNQHARQFKPSGYGLQCITLKPKDLVGIPWRVAFALQADGWYLRSDIIWAKPNPMPESVTDRPTKAHEYLFLLAKSERYYYDDDAVAQPMEIASIKRNQTGWKGNANRGYVNGPQNHMSAYMGSDAAKEQRTRNLRTVWVVPTTPFKEAHFATFPADLIAPCVLAGAPPQGIILDPFMGAGTTALVSARFNRRFLGIELNPEYVAIAERRIRDEVAQAKFL